VIDSAPTAPKVVGTAQCDVHRAGIARIAERIGAVLAVDVADESGCALKHKGVVAARTSEVGGHRSQDVADDVEGVGERAALQRLERRVDKRGRSVTIGLDVRQRPDVVRVFAGQRVLAGAADEFIDAPKATGDDADIASETCGPALVSRTPRSPPRSPRSSVSAAARSVDEARKSLAVAEDEPVLARSADAFSTEVKVKSMRGSATDSRIVPAFAEVMNQSLSKSSRPAGRRLRRHPR